MIKGWLHEKSKIIIIVLLSTILLFLFTKMKGNEHKTDNDLLNISYSETNPTNQSVNATILDSDITIINNDGKNTYTFHDNGEFTFEYLDKKGKKDFKTVKVDWIDKIPPTATITFDLENLTNQNVVATLSEVSEDITITNNDGKNTYIFSDNGEFTFEYVDEAGNKGSTIAKVDWIDKTLPIALISFSQQNESSDPVVATLTNETEPITILNNDGKNMYEFTENGTFEFVYQDQVGNINKTIAVVNWIETMNSSSEQNFLEPETYNPPNIYINIEGVEEETKKPTPKIDKEEKHEEETQEVEIEKKASNKNYILIINLVLLFFLFLKLRKQRREKRKEMNHSLY